MFSPPPEVFVPPQLHPSATNPLPLLQAALRFESAKQKCNLPFTPYAQRLCSGVFSFFEGGAASHPFPLQFLFALVALFCYGPGVFPPAYCAYPRARCFPRRFLAPLSPLASELRICAARYTFFSHSRAPPLTSLLFFYHRREKELPVFSCRRLSDMLTRLAQFFRLSF